MPDIQHAIQIAAKPEKVYPLVATAQGFTEWWAADVIQNDGAAELGFFNRSTLYRLRIKSEQAPARAEWVCETGSEWKETSLLFAFEPRGENTLLRFTHGNWQAASEYFTSCNTTWGELMFRLKAAAEGKSPGPLFSADGMAY